MFHQLIIMLRCQFKLFLIENKYSGALTTHIFFKLKILGRSCIQGITDVEQHGFKRVCCACIKTVCFQGFSAPLNSTVCAHRGKLECFRHLKLFPVQKQLKLSTSLLFTRQTTENTAKVLMGTNYSVELRGQIPVKGKGILTTYFVKTPFDDKL